MIYAAYEAMRLGTRPLAWLLDSGEQLARSPRNPLRNSLLMRALATSFELPARSLRAYPKRPYEVGDPDAADALPEQSIVASLPFADLVNFTAAAGAPKAKVLIAAALSGHHATLLRDTVRAFSRDFDTYVTDWKDARQVPLAAGDFGFDDYVDYLVRFVETLGPGAHLVATCQAAPPAMVAVAELAKRQPELLPASLTLMGGPIDTRINPGFLNKAARKIPLKAFRINNIHTVPPGYPGSGRRVYPGFFQLAGFITLSPTPHLKQYGRFVKNSIRGDHDAVEKFRDFYDEYFAVLDMTESFYLETVRKVFLEHEIPTGQITYRGAPVDFSRVKEMALLTVEGGKDHLCPPGQTEAAHDVFSAISAARRGRHLQEGVGHYGIFSGSTFQKAIYPVIRDFVAAAGGEPAKKARRRRRSDSAAIASG